MDGIFNIYKEKGYTSFDIVAIVRKIVGQKKVGHTGTLDPEACGVLPVCLGKATKLVDFIMDGQKTYRATVTLGKTTTTEDHTGEVLEVKPVSSSEDEILTAVKSFEGEYSQIPPMYSALKVNGKKLYEIARKGEVVERKARNIYINSIVINKFISDCSFEIDVVCSKGTYIRTLCADIGNVLGCGGHMSSLVRLASSNFTVENAITLDELKENFANNDLSKGFFTIDQVLDKFKKITIDKKGTKLLHNGCIIYDYFFSNLETNIDIGETVLVYDYENTFIGMYTYKFDDDKQKYCVKLIKMLKENNA